MGRHTVLSFRIRLKMFTMTGGCTQVSAPADMEEVTERKEERARKGKEDVNNEGIVPYRFADRLARLLRPELDFDFWDTPEK